MQYKTFAEIKALIQRKGDLQDELFVQPQEFQDYIRAAINYCQAEIHKFNCEDTYFEATTPMNLVAGKSDYPLPSDIYANKIRRIVYKRNTDYYEMRRMTKHDRYIDAALTNQYAQSIVYRYMIINNDPRVGPLLRFFPTIRAENVSATASTSATVTSGSPVIVVASATGLAVNAYVSGTGIPRGAQILSIAGLNVTLTVNAYASDTLVPITSVDDGCIVYYIRNVSAPSSDTDFVEIPEFYEFIVQHTLVECLKKEIGNPRLEQELARLEELRKQMTDTLSNMTPDQDDEIEKDMSILEEMS